MSSSATKTPLHLWIIGILSLLWNAVGAFDYSATQLDLDFYMGQFSAEQLAYFDGFPAWAVAFWALGVWGSLIGSIGLLLRKTWALWAFAAALLGLAFTSLYNFVLSNGLEVMGEGAGLFSALIWIIAILLLVYARAMTRRGALA